MSNVLEVKRVSTCLKCDCNVPYVHCLVFNGTGEILLSKSDRVG